MATLFTTPKTPPHQPDPNKARADAEAAQRDKRTRAAGYRSTMLTQWYQANGGGTKGTLGG